MIKTRITEHRITFAPLFLARVNAGEHGQIEGILATFPMSRKSLRRIKVALFRYVDYTLQYNWIKEFGWKADL